MGPIIGKSTVVPHIERVRIIGDVTMVDGMLGHLEPLIVRLLERKLLGKLWLGDVISSSGRKKAGSG